MNVLGTYECIRESTASLASWDIIIKLCFLEVSKMVPDRGYHYRATYGYSIKQV